MEAIGRSVPASGAGSPPGVPAVRIPGSEGDVFLAKGAMFLARLAMFLSRRRCSSQNGRCSSQNGRCSSNRSWFTWDRPVASFRLQANVTVRNPRAWPFGRTASAGSKHRAMMKTSGAGRVPLKAATRFAYRGETLSRAAAFLLRRLTASTTSACCAMPSSSCGSALEEGGNRCSSTRLTSSEGLWASERVIMISQP